MNEGRQPYVDRDGRTLWKGQNAPRVVIRSRVVLAYVPVLIFWFGIASLWNVSASPSGVPGFLQLLGLLLLFFCLHIAAGRFSRSLYRQCFRRHALSAKRAHVATSGFTLRPIEKPITKDAETLCQPADKATIMLDSSGSCDIAFRDISDGEKAYRIIRSTRRRAA